MKKNSLDKNYWENRYDDNATGWDVGYASTPIKAYIDQLKNKELKILIPGAGNSYEAEYLWNNGFKNVFVLDVAKNPIMNFLKRVKGFPQSNCLHMDFFDLNDQFDLVIEQTFFCALDPNLRPNYVKKMVEILTNNGKLVGLLFDFPLSTSGPPFGGTRQLYCSYFNHYFDVKILEKAYNSIESRKDKELFFIFEKKTK